MAELQSRMHYNARNPDKIWLLFDLDSLSSKSGGCDFTVLHARNRQYCIGNRHMGPVLIWPNITIVVNVVFLEISALTKLWHIVNSKGIIVLKRVVTDSCIWFVTCLYFLENGILLPIPHTQHMWQQITHSQLLTFCVNQSQNCLHLSVTT